jgi:hypothetical protein
MDTVNSNVPFPFPAGSKGSSGDFLREEVRLDGLDITEYELDL